MWGEAAFKLEHPFVYFSNQHNVLVKVPAGFIFDGASIPRFFWRIIGHPFETWVPAACIHDWLYYSGEHPRKLSDEIFREALRELPAIPSWKERMFYRGVRVGGRRAWKKHRARSQ